jgi:hypothetical protein
LVTSFLQINLPTRIFCKNGFGTWRGQATEEEGGRLLAEKRAYLYSWIGAVNTNGFRAAAATHSAEGHVKHLAASPSPAPVKWGTFSPAR